MNDTQITLTGRIGGDVTLRELTDGRAVATFRLACTPTRYRDGEWVKGTTSWHTVKAWNRLGRHVAASLASGDPVVVPGRLVADVWEREGKPQTSFEVVASAVGHDLSFGTTVLSRPVPASDPASDPASVPATTPSATPVATPAVADAGEIGQPARAA
jgi:single-strand DNA-binding protein